MRKYFFLIFFIIISFEFYLKFSSPVIHERDHELGWKLKKNLDLNFSQKTLNGEKYEVNFSTNENGSRFYGDKKKAKIKVLAIGDSFTNMPYASNDKMWFSIFAKRVEKDFNSNVYVEAFGAGGYGNLQQYIILKRFRKKIDPDFILFQFCNNDFMDNTYKWEITSYNRNQFMRRPYLNLINSEIEYHKSFYKYFYESYLFENFRLINRMDLFLSVIQSLIRFHVFEISSYNVSDNIKKESVGITSKIFEKIKKLFPLKEIYVFNCSKDERYPYNSWYNIASENLMIPINIFDQFIYSDELFYKDKGHFNEKGNFLIGNLLYERIKKLINTK